MTINDDDDDVKLQAQNRNVGSYSTLLQPRTATDVDIFSYDIILSHCRGLHSRKS